VGPHHCVVVVQRSFFSLINLLFSIHKNTEWNGTKLKNHPSFNYFFSKFANVPTTVQHDCLKGTIAKIRISLLAVFFNNRLFVYVLLKK
jgi:hypothetical protein